MKISNEVIEFIKSSNEVVIYTHIRPDADALGSACALKLAFEKMGKNADVFCDSELPANYNFIIGVNKINRPQLKQYDSAIAVDCGDINRLGKYVVNFKTYERTLNIDHHVTNDNFANINFVQDASSTGEILYFIFKQLKIKLDRELSTALYASISSDTGCFLHANTTSVCHKVAGILLKNKVDVGKVNYFLFKRKSIGQIKLLQIALKNLKFYLDNRVSIMYLKADDFKTCNINNIENYGLVDTCINIEKVEVGILVSEIKPNLWACSIRGKGSVDVSQIAKQFGGGGHTNAAGCNVFGTCNTVLNKLVRACNKIL